MTNQHSEAQAYLAAIIASSDDAIVSKNLDGVITSWNAAAERIFGYSAEEAIGRHITLIIPPERLAEETEILGNLKRGRRIDHFETWRRRKDGTLIPISITVSPIHDATGKIIGASKVARDISERLKIDAALQEMNRKKEEFISNMSHELRTPMNAVIGLANLLQLSKNLSEKDRKFVDTLKLSADSLLELINDLLDFSRIEAGSIELEQVEFSLAEQISKTLDVMSVKANEKNISTHISYDDALNRYFIGDPLRIQQILMNLLSNAVKFSEQGSIEIAVEGAQGLSAGTTMVTIRVSDSGIGIAPDKLGSIFDKFTQADSSITRRYGGSGLGLAITKALVERMGGSIGVKSELGAGTTFTVTIPFKNSEWRQTAASRPPMEQAPPPLPVKNILLVEDHEPNIVVAGGMLEKLGYEYDVARSGIEALKKFELGSYDVVLMDIQMHGMDGLEATRRIRRRETEEDLVHTPIIAMTAHVMEQDKDKCIAAGMDDFIPKPFEPSDLSKKIAYFAAAKRKAEIAGRPI